MNDGNQINLKTALKISASCCAQVSYRKNDPSIEKAEVIFDRLINSVPVHASPVEHQCTPIMYSSNVLDYFNIQGVTSIDRNMVPWSGNLHGWVQYRQLINNNVQLY